MEEKEKEFEKKIKNLLEKFAEQSYINRSTTEDIKNQEIIDTCIDLWKLDYKCEIIDNSCGVICDSYPSKIVLPLYELGPGGGFVPNSCPVSLAAHNNYSDNSNSFINKDLEDCEKHINGDLHKNGEIPTFASVVAGSTNDTNTENKFTQNNVYNSKDNGAPQNLSSFLSEVRSHLKDARRARCRYRVPIPVILCKGKYISRAGTLSGFLDVYRKNLVLYATDTKDSVPDPKELKEAVNDMAEESSSFYDVETARNADIKLLKILGMSQIIDLMVEHKKVKFFVNITSSEKADSKDRYFEFRIASMPYPGCEYFVNFTKNRLSSEGLLIDWNSPINDAELSLPDGFTGRIPSRITKDWDSYRSWDLRKLTEYYLQYILGYVTEDQSVEKGFLIHCISGWDRTPLFISLLRLSLWADGLIHTSLDALQMLFFTLAYDWYLFGHQLSTRLGQKENIMYFCFEFLDLILKDNYPDFTEYRARHPSADSEMAESIERVADGGYDTPSSFGSTNSIDLVSTHPPSTGTHSHQQQPNIRVSVSQSSHEHYSNWPFNKENGFSFDGISENVSGVETGMSGLSLSSVSTSSNSSHAGINGSNETSKRVSPSRTPLKDRNKGAPNKRTRKISAEEHSASASSSASPLTSSCSSAENRNCFKNSSSIKKSNLNGFLRDFTSRRSRKSSVTETPARFTTGSESIEFDASDISGTSDSESGCIGTVSNPVAVPGSRARHDSSGSSVGSWQFLSPTDTMRDSMDNHRSSRNSLIFNMDESTQTIQEEVTPPSSLDSSQSIIVFDRRQRLAEVKEAFCRLYNEVPVLKQEQSGFVDLLSNMVQRVVT